jgi:PAS domain S-box-containing protein
MLKRRKVSKPKTQRAGRRAGNLQQIAELVRRATGLDLGQYKPEAVRKQIRLRMALRHLDRLEGYAACLTDNPEEVEKLYRKLTGTTGFFRDPEIFAALKNRIFPEIINRLPVDERVRVWVPECQTGQEAYSIAIAFREAADICGRYVPIRIFATDSNTKAIQQARAGIYPGNIENEVTPERLQRFFVKSDRGYQVKDLLRTMCFFARQDLVADPPFSRLDLVVFRKQLTALLPISQERAVISLHYSLAPSGLLLLGSAATARTVAGLFKVEDPKRQIYSKMPIWSDRRAHLKGNEQRIKGRSTAPLKSSGTQRPRRGARQSEYRMRRELETAIAQETARTEDLQRTNEELLSSNEELESLNEELQNVQEQLVSSNEALAAKNQEALQANDDLINLLSSTEMPIIMVDRDLRIRRFTPMAKLLLNILETDIGRPFTDLNLNVELPLLPASVCEVMETVRSTQQEVQDSRGNWYNLQIRPYKTKLGRIDGAVIAMVDIDQLKRDREKLRLLVELSFEPIIVWDFERGIVDWNKGCERLYGFKRAEAVARDIHDLLRAAPPGTTAELIAQLQTSGEWKGELRYTTKDGRIVVVESRLQTAEVAGRPIVLETNYDITETKRAELNADFVNTLDLAIAQITDADEIVRLSTRRLGEYLGVARCHLSEINLQSNVSIVRKTWEGWLQGAPSMAGEYPIDSYVSPEQRATLEMGQPIVIDDVMTHPQFREFASQYAALAIRSTLSTPVARQGQWEATLTATHPEPRKWRPDEVQLMRDTGLRVWLAVQQSRSLALLRESAARARRTLVEQMVAGVAETDATGRLTMVNQRYCDITGRSGDELSQLRICDITHPDDWPSNAELYKRLFETGESFFIEKRYVRKDGSETWVNTHVSPIRDAQGKIEQSVSVVVDITDRKHAEEQLLAAYEQAEAATRAKDQFLSVVSHELRTPLVSILGYTQLLHAGAPDPALIRRVVEVVEKNSKLQLQLIEDLLDTSRIISGKLKLEVGPVNLADVINTALDVVRPAAEVKGIQLRSILDPLAAQITGDPERLQQIVWNLLSNSIKFTPKGGLVEVDLGRADRYVQIVVRDSGKGIDEEFLPYVFDRFRQRDMSSTRRTGGLGLGLALVKDLVELHGGKVQVESAGQDRGATFTVRLPVRAVYTPPAAEGEPVPTVPRDEAELLSGVRLLVVDDEQDVRMLLALTLEKYGAHVEAVSSGREAMEALAAPPANRPFDVMICDIGMPDEDGYDVIRKVRAMPSYKCGRIPAIALTAYGGAEYRTRALEGGFNIHAVKPVKADDLVAMIQSVMKQRRLAAG